MLQLILLFLAGGCGCLARFGSAILVQRYYSGTFPLATLIVNIAGCVLFGAVCSLAEQRMVISPQTRAILLTGFMGSFTTFSTFAFESSNLLRDAEFGMAMGNMLSHVVLGILAINLGMAIVRQF